MKNIQSFSGMLNRGFRGNVTYNLRLPSGITALSVTLTHNKERIQNREAYLERYGSELLPVLNSYLGRNASRQELEHYTASMKTEIQLGLTVGGEFAGNVHMPGEQKKIYISAAEASRGCLPCSHLEGMAKIIVHVFQVVEDGTAYFLEVKGDF